jgi:CheY-specific phosphatase CheX
MKEALKTAMTTSISEVLETMFFMTIDISDETEPSSFIESTPENLMVSKIIFSGPLSGNFLFMVPENILRDMTQIFMGIDEEEVTNTHLTGTLSEGINMIAGNTFSKLDDQAVFNLGIPEILEATTISNHEPIPGSEDIFILIETPDGNIGLHGFYSV